MELRIGGSRDVSTRYIGRPASGIFTASGDQAAISSGEVVDCVFIPNPMNSNIAPETARGAPNARANGSPGTPRMTPDPTTKHAQAAITVFVRRCDAGVLRGTDNKHWRGVQPLKLAPLRVLSQV